MADKEIPLYNIENAVGPGCPNGRTDVALVQFFLHQILTHPRMALAKPPGEKIKITGSFDPTTGVWIKAYQDDKKKRHSIFADGRIDRAKGAQYDNASISQTTYTIVHLNIDHARLFRSEHNHLERHPLIPGDLKAELQQGEPRG
jgi:hypothetical protein